MAAIRAKVEKGRLVLNEPTSLPEGTVLDLVIDDEGDDLSAAERNALHRVISRAWQFIQEGKGKAGSEVIENLLRR